MTKPTLFTHSRLFPPQELLDMQKLLQLTVYICSPGEVWGVWQQLVPQRHVAQSHV